MHEDAAVDRAPPIILLLHSGGTQSALYPGHLPTARIESDPGPVWTLRRRKDSFPHAESTTPILRSPSP
jgi:hypothetical protein